MAIKISDLINKRHDMLRRCVAFDYEIVPMDKERKPITLHFQNISSESDALWNVSWNLLSATGFDNVKNLGYSISYSMPMKNMQLVMVCAYGLRCFSAALADTVQDLSAYEFLCYDVTKDM